VEASSEEVRLGETERRRSKRGSREGVGGKEEEKKIEEREDGRS